MNSETLLQEKHEDDFQWATEYGYLNKFPASSQPVAPCNEQCHRLMIFSGLHAGASMPLTDGTYSLGRSYECDIVLKDPGIEPIHMKVICDADTIALRPELGAVHLDRQLVRHETVLPKPPTVVTVAGVHLGLAIENAAWCPLDFPRINENAGNPTGKDPQEQTGGDDITFLSSARTAITKAVNIAFIRPVKANALSKYVPLTFILIFLFSAIFLFHFEEPDNTVLIPDIEKQFTERHLPKPVIQIDTQGFLDITAYAPDDSKKKEIECILDALPVIVRSHVYTDAKVGRALQNYISKMAYPVETVYKGSGRVIVKGFLENQQEADILKGLLKSNVMGLRKVDLNVFLLDQVRPDLSAILKASGLENKIDLQPQSDRLLAKGNVDTEESVRWQKAKKTILDRWGRQFDIVDQVKNREYAMIPGKIDIPIAGVTLHPHTFITLQDGKVYFKGASLKNGTIIKDIGPERIIVEVNGQDYYYNY